MIRHTVGRLERGARALRATTPVPPPPESDADQLARESAQAFADALARFRQAKAGDKPDDPTAPPGDWYLQAIREKAPEDFTFFDFERLARHDPAEATARWADVMAAARRDLDSGWLAGRALEYQGGSAWGRACFLAVRDRLRRAWQPRNDAEALLIDQIAQYEMIRRDWVRLLALWSAEPQTIIALRRRGELARDDRHVGAAQATLEAARMLERVQRAQQNTIRLLLSLRRSRAAVTVRNTGPVNVALGPQLNVAGPPPDPDPAPAVRVRAAGPGDEGAAAAGPV